MKNVTERVLDMLEKHPHLRDNDGALIANLWYESYIAVGEKIGMEFDEEMKVGVAKFLRLVAKQKLPNYKTVIRYRAKLQKDRTDLRGEKYIERQGLSEFWKKEYGRV